MAAWRVASSQYRCKCLAQWDRCSAPRHTPTCKTGFAPRIPTHRRRGCSSIAYAWLLGRMPGFCIGSHLVSSCRWCSSVRIATRNSFNVRSGLVVPYAPPHWLWMSRCGDELAMAAPRFALSSHVCVCVICQGRRQLHRHGLMLLVPSRSALALLCSVSIVLTVVAACCGQQGLGCHTLAHRATA